MAEIYYNALSAITRIWRRHALTAAGVILAAGLSFTLTGCAIDVGWNPTPPHGWNSTFYDQALDGCWRLESINSQYVGGYDVNYLYFNGDGRGEYLYYDHSPTTMNYWFTDGGDALWMQWRNSYGLQTYVYVYEPRMPW